ncbi:MAG: HAMP domain-containing histidine kinase, partial [Clostridia bacterium]|nr:HAMP domain-containing histidine kinase [Clostridia bacterium]
YLLTKGDDTLGAVRYVVSLKQTNRQILSILFALLIVFLAIGLIMLVSGLSFIDSIVTPITQINEVTKRIAGGDMSARMEPQEYKDEISELSENINFMADELSSTDKMKNDFISTVSHEMKTPLTAIKGWAETLQAMGDTDPATTKRGMEVIIDESSRLTGVVEDLLDLSKIVNGRMTLRYEKIDILAELDDTIFVFKDRSMREGIELIYNVPHVPAPAEGDPNRINQVFVNILDNAFKYTEQGGKITVFAEMIPPEEEGGDKSTLRVFVEDTGIGISEEELPKVRKKFYKSNISSRGSGIGLAVVDEIVKMHGGTMDIQSEVGVGTCVILSFPVDYVPAPAPELETETTEVEQEMS